MQRLVQECWALRGPAWAQHVGDLAWARYQHVGREHLWRTRLWEEHGRAVAYGWLFEGDVLDFCVHPERPELLDHLPDSRVPAGFELRTVSDADVGSRVDAHRSAFDPSRVTLESYRNVMRAWPYRADLDCIALAPDGRVAAYCLAWLDDENRAGELEPVGTHADFRRLGLAAAVCTCALQRLRDEGADLAVVYARGDEAYAAPKRLYESLGFRAHARTITYRAGASA